MGYCNIHPRIMIRPAIDNEHSLMKFIAFSLYTVFPQNRHIRWDRNIIVNWCNRISHSKADAYLASKTIVCYWLHLLEHMIQRIHGIHERTLCRMIAYDNQMWAKESAYGFTQVIRLLHHCQYFVKGFDFSKPVPFVVRQHCHIVFHTNFLFESEEQKK